jgi:hypothetical protein
MIIQILKTIASVTPLSPNERKAYKRSIKKIISVMGGEGILFKFLDRINKKNTVVFKRPKELNKIISNEKFVSNPFQIRARVPNRFPSQFSNNETGFIFSRIEGYLNDYDFNIDQNLLYGASLSLELYKNLNKSEEKDKIPNSTLILVDSHEELNWFIKNINLQKEKNSIYTNIENKELKFISINSSNFQEISRFENVYVLNSPLAVYSILLGINTHVWGQPFYAGWGFTFDQNKVQRKRSLEAIHLFYVIFYLIPNYPQYTKYPLYGFLVDLFLTVFEENFLDTTQKSFDHIFTFISHPNDFNEIKLKSLIESFEGDLFKTFILIYIRSQLKEKVDSLQYDNAVKGIINTKELEIYTKVTNVSQINITNNYAFKMSEGLDLFEKGKYQEALERFYQCIHLDKAPYEVFRKISEICFLNLDFHSAALIIDFYKSLPEKGFNTSAWNLSSRYHALDKNYFKTIHGMITTCLGNPRNIPKYFEDSIADVPHFLGNLPFKEVFDIILLNFRVGKALDQCRALIEMNHPEKAEEILVQYKPDILEFEKYALCLANAYRSQRKYKEASEVISILLSKIPYSLKANIEAVQLASDSGQFLEATKLIKKSFSKGIPIPEMYIRRNGKALMDIKDVFLSHREIRSKLILKKYLGHKIVDTLNEFKTLPKTGKYKVILPYFGPGDELRYVSFYPQMQEYCLGEKIIFGSDPRLYELFKRSFPKLEFYPISRIRNLTWCKSYDHLRGMPGADLFRHMDKKGWDLVDNSDGVIIQLDALYDVVKDYSSFKAESYLVPDKKQVDYWKEKVQKNKPKKLVGLCWRSSLNTPSRHKGYITVDLLAPLFEMEDVIFINLQYGDCIYELNEIEKKYPGKIINFSELDLFNDLDGTAALMETLDMVIAPPTTIAELAGGIGKNTVMFTSSSQYKWRLFPESNDDVWHKTLINVNCADKSKLVQLIKREILKL